MTADPHPPDLPPYTPRPADAPTALGGIRIVDFTHFVAGPVATMLLADLGAEVIKIEKPEGGDDFRTFQPFRHGLGAPFAWANRNKKSIVLDLTRPDGQQVARDLVAGADVVVENFSAGVMDRFGLGWDALSALNPRLIYCAVSAYGRSGPDADRLGFDPIAQAESGFMSMNGFPDHEPLRAGPAVMDMTTAFMASHTILGALMARTHLGTGQYVEVSLFDTAVMMVGFHALSYLMSGVPATRFGNNSNDAVPVGVFHASDGPFYLAVANDRIFTRLTDQVLDRPDLGAHPHFARGLGRVEHKAELWGLLESLFAHHPRQHWLDRMRAAGVPAGAVRSLAEGMTSPEIRARGSLTELEHPVIGPVPNVAPPFRYSRTPIVDPEPAPLLGQHQHEVLTGVLGYDPATVERLGRAGAFGPAPEAGEPERRAS